MELSIIEIILGIISLAGTLGTAYFGYRTSHYEKVDTVFSQNSTLIKQNILLRQALNLLDNDLLKWKISMRKLIRDQTSTIIKSIDDIHDLTQDQKVKLWSIAHKNRESMSIMFDGKFPELNKLVLVAVDNSSINQTQEQ